MSVRQLELFFLDVIVSLFLTLQVLLLTSGVLHSVRCSVHEGWSRFLLGVDTAVSGLRPQRVFRLSRDLESAGRGCLVGMQIGQITRVGPNRTEAVNQYKLYAFIRDSFILDAVSRKDVFYLLPLIGEAHHVNLLEPAFDVPAYLLDVDEVAVGLVVEVAQLPPLDERLPRPLPIALIVDDEVYPAG